MQVLEECKDEKEVLRRERTPSAFRPSTRLAYPLHLLASKLIDAFTLPRISD
jgi:hypothetical protein